MKDFSAQHFFDLTDVSFKELFEKEYVWSALSDLSAYIEEQFKSGKIKANHGDDVFVGEGTTIEEGAFIKGPAIIGAHCFIGHNAHIRGGVLLDKNVHVGHGSEIKHSILLTGAKVAHLNYVGDSIVGRDVNMGGGSKTANLRLDEQNVRVRVGEESIDTGLAKLGAIIGDGTKIGVNAVLNPGAILGKNCLVHPLIAAVGVHEEGSVLK